MRPCLLLALALLGTASARHLGGQAGGDGAGARVGAGAGGRGRGRGVPAGGRDGGAEHHGAAERPHLPLRYIIVRRCQNFHTAQRVCSRCYRGRLASIHSYRTNVLLQCRARARVNNRRVWIGAITRPVGGSVFCHWSDRSGWNYAYWLHGYPLLTGRFCTTLCTANGRWRSTRCRVRLPFICEY
ncbi:bone marrow proteoglycan-like [Anas acuta]|uniref:bone marrow proteoglycan-like n=1 Tax=Anas acuta TaxID=28680 RepID=UPI0035C8D873